jgi:hypothetical protein
MPQANVTVEMLAMVSIDEEALGPEDADDDAEEF